MEQQAAAQPAAPSGLGLTVERLSIKDAAQLLLRGKVDAAIQTLYLLRRRSPKNPTVALLLGHAYFHKLWRTDGLREYSEAVKLRGALRHDRQLLKNTVLALDDPTYRLARAVITRQLGASAVGELRAAAHSRRNPRVQKRAERLVAELSPSRRRGWRWR
jgi:hypothetical protein